MRTAGNAERRPFAGSVPHAGKASLGRTSIDRTPLSIHRGGVGTNAAFEDHMRKHLGFKLGKVASHIESVTVSFEDVNGRRGGVDTSCRIKVVLSHMASVLVEELGFDAAEAFDRAATRVEQAVRGHLDRARTVRRSVKQY
ncbi:MAG TPA: HPF/RaiA family ribosome-associated protein [Polyangiaceae bacterium]|jgi:ribosome-associated translation inhibitor RaiA|nr:HPF/RaiA family ribosome-associated protein [Polyangiaceae bacterium]